MDPGYETVIDPSTVLWTMTAMVIHGVMVAVQAGLIGFLLVTGALGLFFPTLESPLLRRLGALPASVAGAPSTRSLGAARLALGLALACPLVVGAGFGVSLAASLGVVALLLWGERRRARDDARLGRLVRRAAIVSAALVAAFALWEGEDGLDLGVEVIGTAQHWRVHELDWQLANDVSAPKVGDLAPDFELQDPSGETAVRLSDFRGTRPVALVFGSYT